MSKNEKNSPLNSNAASKKKPQRRSGELPQSAEEINALLDEALDESFPASDAASSMRFTDQK
ncbi:hypothetical protein [Rhizobium mesosinicum]|uniref:Chromosome partitioning protein ParB n=1 Tax=Rhizobium mesosinicum TaxID=335017 RepID=A0ABS7GNZ5_9HYPH|nr:hypothetical protein [Rhizobium mesosinicum]MBW9051058.1 hypothetical protein [Rhizobium mesosinicum]